MEFRLLQLLCYCCWCCLCLVVLTVLVRAQETTSSSSVYVQPEQIHLAYSDDLSEMVVTWSTFNATPSVVEYGTGALTQADNGTTTLFVDGGDEHRPQFIHRVKLKGLMPGRKYWYHCGSDLGWSSVYYFTTPSDESTWSPHLAIYGDLGSVNAQSLARLQEEVQAGVYDAILHVGDFAYDMDSDNARMGDQFMRQIEPIAALVPYMVCVGNHEQKYNFSNYKNRFSMPGTENNLMYSFNMGPIHFISIASEFYYFLQYGIKQVVKQYKWLEEDLKNASLPEQRAKRPWIVTFGHRPMYCSNADHDDCVYHETLVRVGIPILHWFGLEKLFYTYGVDLQLWAHEHSYERLWPIYNREVYNGSESAPYTNPGAPVHITTGSAGCQEDHDEFRPNVPPWSAFHSTDYGYSRMKVFNASHLHFEQVSDDQGGKVIDSFWLIKDKHGPYDKWGHNI